MITTLIPAYKTEFISDLLHGLSSQTFKNFKVILSDDSPNDEVTTLIKTPKFKSILSNINIEIIRGPKNGSMANISNLITNWNKTSDYVHLLFDDDLIYPLFYQLHVKSHHEYDIGASVSLRWVASENSQPFKLPATPSIFLLADKVYGSIDSNMLFKTVIPSARNWLGEMSNILLKKESVDIYERSTNFDIPYYGLSDIGSLLEISLTKNIGLINHHLGFFRKSDLQNTGNLKSISLKCAYVGWISIILMSLYSKKISLNEANAGLARICRIILKNYPNDQQMLDFAHLPLIAEINSDKFKSEFNSRWQQLLSQDASWVQSCQMRNNR